MKKILNLIPLAFFVISCVKVSEIPDIPPADFTIGGGLLFVNEGNFRTGMVHFLFIRTIL